MDAHMCHGLGSMRLEMSGKVAAHRPISIIFMTGQGDIPMNVRAILR